MISLSGGAMGGSDVPAACPPVVEYSRTEQSRIAEETLALPEDAKIILWLADYAVMREQARACAIGGR
jgi:hypothetical protein